MHGVLINKQHGFRSKRPTGIQLLCTTHDITYVIERNKQMHMAI